MPTSVWRPAQACKIPADAEERAIYTLDGEIDDLGDRFPAERLLVFRPGDEIVVSSERGAHFMLFGGASLGSKRYIWWNFVSSSKERIEQAKKNGRPAASISFPATRKNSFRCRKAEARHLHAFTFDARRSYRCPQIQSGAAIDVNAKPETPLLDKVRLPADLRALDEARPAAARRRTARRD